VSIDIVETNGPTLTRDWLSFCIPRLTPPAVEAATPPPTLGNRGSRSRTGRSRIHAGWKLTSTPGFLPSTATGWQCVHPGRGPRLYLDRRDPGLFHRYPMKSNTVSFVTDGSPSSALAHRA